jgi:hypothetical protein
MRSRTNPRILRSGGRNTTHATCLVGIWLDGDSLASTRTDGVPVLVSSMLSHLGEGWWLHAVPPASSLGCFQRISLDFTPKHQDKVPKDNCDISFWSLRSTS